MTAYVYDTETREVAYTVEGEDAAKVQETAEGLCEYDQHSITYSPAFGTNDGLLLTKDSQTVAA